MREYYVAVTGSDKGKGTKEQPYRTISKAALEALPGDRVIVSGGEYREWVKPAHGGHSNVTRITYEGAPGEKVVIKGSERIASWEQVEGNVWKVILYNDFFGSYNPYKCWMEIGISKSQVIPFIREMCIETGDPFMRHTVWRI
jgi:hypothetical protein